MYSPIKIILPIFCMFASLWYFQNEEPYLGKAVRYTCKMIMKLPHMAYFINTLLA
jgi:hypothetical protein